MAALLIIKVFDDVNTSEVAAFVVEDGVLVLEAVTDADGEVLVSPKVMVDAVLATMEGSSVLVLTVLEVLDTNKHGLLDFARAEALVDIGVDVTMNPVVLNKINANMLTCYCSIMVETE